MTMPLHTRTTPPAPVTAPAHSCAVLPRRIPLTAAAHSCAALPRAALPRAALLCVVLLAAAPARAANKALMIDSSTGTLVDPGVVVNLLGNTTIDGASPVVSGGDETFGNVTVTGNLTAAGDVDFDSGNIDGISIGSATPAAGRFTTLTATGNIDFNAGSIDGIPIGANSAAAGTFTSLVATGNVDFSAGEIDSIPIGVNAAAAGQFTTLYASGNFAVGGTDFVVDTAGNVTFAPTGGTVSVTGSASVSVDFAVSGTDFVVDANGNISIAPYAGTVIVTGDIDQTGDLSITGNLSATGTSPTDSDGNTYADVAEALREDSGPTTLTVGNISDGEVLIRSGTTITSQAAGAGDMTKATYDTDDDGAVDTVAAKNGSTAAGNISIYEDSDDGTNKATITVPALAADYTLTLPTTDGGAAEYLKTDGNGTLSWDSPAGGGDMTEATYTDGGNAGMLDTENGGTDANSSAWTGVATVSAGTWSAQAQLTHELGGLEADVSAYDGLVKISGGNTSAVVVPLTHENGGLEADVSAYDGLVKISGGNTSVATAGTDYAETRTGVYRTIWFDAGAFVARTTNGMESGTEEYATNDVMSDYFLADADTDEAVQVRIAMPDVWDRGVVWAKVFWTTGTAGNSTVWGVRGKALSNDDAIDSAWGTAVTVTDAVIATGDLHVTAATGNITIGGTPALGDLVWIEVYRDADNGSDDNTGDAKFLGIQLQYTESSTEPSAW